MSNEDETEFTITDRSEALVEPLSLVECAMQLLSRAALRSQFRAVSKVVCRSVAESSTRPNPAEDDDT